MEKNRLKRSLDLLREAVNATKRTLEPVGKSPDEALGELFRMVQLARIYPDGKAFVDKVPNSELRKIVKLYEKESHQSDFDLARFINQHFEEFVSATQDSDRALASEDPEKHIAELWNVLTRRAPKSVGSLLALPKPYVVPGGRFGEQYYWDSYFTMLGLEASGRQDIADGMINNAQHMFAKFGFIPTGNRNYYLTRSQPPFFLHMLQLIAPRRGGLRYLLPKLPYLTAEHGYWTKNTSDFLKTKRGSYKRLVRMPNGTALSRYYDSIDTPRPESFREDHETAVASGRKESVVYRHLRAGAESGWDYSSRWLADGTKLETIETTNIVPLDLNCLLYELELALAELYDKLLQYPVAALYRRKAKKRREAILQFMWDEEAGFFFDWHAQKNSHTEIWSLAGVFPLYCGLASHEQAAKVAHAIEAKFLKAGGVLTTLHETGQQWDAPNGWAPLQWVTIVGLRRYGFDVLADTIKYRWLATNEAVYANQHKFVEKYNVVDTAELAGGGEYTVQDGFGWTNGVFMALRHDDDKKIAKKVPTP